MKGQFLKGKESLPFEKGKQGRSREVLHEQVCVMQTAKAYLELIRERGKKGLPLERVYRQVFNKDLFLMA